MINTYQHRLSLVLLTIAFIGSIAMTLAVENANADTRTPLSGPVGPGSSGSDVRALQEFLAANALIYPQGLVTGFYGPLTQSAVVQFQIGYGIPAVGRVGPITLAKINSIIASGSAIDVSAPGISGVQVVRSSGSATVSWATTEPTRGALYYASTPIFTNEVATALTEPSTTGTRVFDASLQTTHQVPLTGLQPGQTYYYVIHAIDMTGNVSITLPVSFVAQ